MKGELCYKCRAVGDETFKNCNCILNWNEIKALAQKFYVPIWKVLFALFYCKNTCIAQEFLHEKKNFRFHKKQGYTLRDCTTRKPLDNKWMKERARKNARLMIDFKRVKVGTTECKEKLLVLKIDLSDMTRVSEKAYFFSETKGEEAEAYKDVQSGKRRIYEIPYKYRDAKMYTYAYCFAKAEEDRVEIKVIENLLLKDIAKRDIRFTDKFDKHPDMGYWVSAYSLRIVCEKYFSNGHAF